ncbi:MAG: TetR family transcriptional regulator [Myxococcales bacterium]|nr:TetR family transcriptional regulator [Myxococcales bacterium]
MDQASIEGIAPAVHATNETDMPRGREAVVAALIAAATRLFAERGIEGASVRDVAGAAGVNHALVFRHFGSKARLVRRVLDELLDDLVAEFRQAGVDPQAIAAVGEGVASQENLWKLVTRAVLDGQVDFLTEREFPEIEPVLVAVDRVAAAGFGIEGLERVTGRDLVLLVLAGAVGWVLMDPILAETVGIPGETPGRRRRLARAAFLELIGLAEPGSLPLEPDEARKAAVPSEPPERIQGAAERPSVAIAREDPPRGRDQVIEALTDAATSLVAERGAAAVSVREIAARAGVNHALVFRHFGSKDGLIQAVWDRLVADLAGRVTRVPDFASLTDLTEALARSETTWKLVARALLDGGAGTVSAVRYHFVDAMVWATDQAQQDGLLRSRIHPRVLVAMTLATGFGYLVFHPVLRPLLGIAEGDPEAERDELRAVVGAMLGWSRPERPRADG